MKSPHSKERIPSLLHTVNAVGFLSFLTIIFFGTTEREAWLALSIILGGAFISLYLYYRLRFSYKVVSAVFSFSLCIFMYVAFAESIFFIENITGIGISRRISMGIKLQQRAVRELKKKDDVFELAGKDPLFYHRVPGSIHRYQYDHEKPNPWYEAVVDETGYLNVRRGLYRSSATMDVFVSGDSVLQGVGMPSCIEKVAKSGLVSIWNLSTGNYGPHEKTQALLTYGISKKPKWLILEFFSGNDVSDANEDDVLALEGQTFEGRFAKEETLVYFAISPKYRGIVNHDVPVDRYTYQLVCFVKLTRLNNLTFSFTHEIATKIMKAFRRNRSKAIGPDIGNDKIRRVAYPAEAHFDIVPDKYSDWVLLGLENTLRHYRRFINEVRKLDNLPQIALLYNPSSYEIYRNLLIDQDGSQDALADMQWHALRTFANENGITFIDLLPLLRKRVAEVQPPIWLYGKNDLVHWSQAGTDVVADVLKKEFDRIGIS